MANGLLFDEMEYERAKKKEQEFYKTGGKNCARASLAGGQCATRQIVSTVICVIPIKKYGKILRHNIAARIVSISPLDFPIHYRFYRLIHGDLSSEY